MTKEELCIILLLYGYKEQSVLDHYRFSKGESRFVFRKDMTKFLVRKRHASDALIYTNLERALKTVGIEP